MECDASSAATGTLCVMLCACNEEPKLCRLEQEEEPLLENVLASLQSLLKSLHYKDHAQPFGIDDRLRLDVSGPFVNFSLRAVLNLDHEKSELERNAYVSDMMQDIWGPGAPSFYGTVVWLVSSAKEDMDGKNVDVVFNFDEPCVGSFILLRSEWKGGRYNAQPIGAIKGGVGA